MPVRAVSFDFHDTLAICPDWFLLETRHLVSATYARLVEGGYLPDGHEAAALDLAYRELRLAIHEHGEEQDALNCALSVLARFDLAPPRQAVADTLDTLMRATLATCEPRPGVVAAMRELAEAGLPLGITSNAVYHPFLEWSLERFELRQAVRSVVSSASCGYYKSRPEIFHVTAGAVGVRVDEMVHIGDSFRFDIAPARALGARTIWLNLTGQPPPEENVADVEVTDLEGLSGKVLAL